VVKTACLELSVFAAMMRAHASAEVGGGHAAMLVQLRLSKLTTEAKFLANPFGGSQLSRACIEAMVGPPGASFMGHAISRSEGLGNSTPKKKEIDGTTADAAAEGAGVEGVAGGGSCVLRQQKKKLRPGAGNLASSCKSTQNACDRPHKQFKLCGGCSGGVYMER
jgi:hypothetical protein